jgi:enamine deaminase RidA (YjgF/YER057c/UK114 family)
MVGRRIAKPRKKRERSKTMTPTGQVQYLNPDALNKNPAFTNVVVVTGPVKTVYVGGQDAVDASGTIIGKGDIKAQTEQVLKNIQVALAAGGAIGAYYQVESLHCSGTIPSGGL